MFLALTGHRLHLGDLLYTGLATHFVPHAELQALGHCVLKPVFTLDTYVLKSVFTLGVSALKPVPVLRVIL